MYKKMVLPIILITSTSAQSFFDAFDDLLENQIQMMESMRTGMQGAQQALQKQHASVHIAEKKDRAIICIKGITADSFDATLNDDNDTLIIKAPNNSVTIRTSDRFISVSLVHEQKEEQKKENGQWIMSGSSVMQTGRAISQPINLEKPAIEYDATEHALNIALPMETKKVGKPVPVKMISSVQPDNCEQPDEK